MANLISFDDMKNEIIMELRNENRKIVEKLDITQRSIESQNSIIISLSGELKNVKKGKVQDIFLLFFDLIKLTIFFYLIKKCLSMLNRSDIWILY